MSLGQEERIEGDLFIGLVNTIGTNRLTIKSQIEDILKQYGYEVVHIKFSDFIKEATQKIIKKKSTFMSSIIEEESLSYFEKINYYMNIGNLLREEISSSYLSMEAVKKIKKERNKNKKNAFILDSFKHPDEIYAISSIYRDSFYIFSIYSSEETALDNLISDKTNTLLKEQAKIIIDRDKGEKSKYGQQMRKAFELGDFFINNDDANYSKAEIIRIIELMHNYPYHTPTIDEYLMFNAYVAGTKSADLSRQVGALVGTKDGDILATGSNDCVKASGGQYWQHYDDNHKIFTDSPFGRDYTREKDPNKNEIKSIKDEIKQKTNTMIENYSSKVEPTLLNDLTNEFKSIIDDSKLNSLTEYGRIVHTEMNAILSCSRNRASIQNQILYCTTFPCHNCAKHIVDAGIKKVIYIEPYPKSKTLEFYNDSITKDINEKQKVQFLQFMGVGPNKYLEMFSMIHKNNKKLRKSEDGTIIKNDEWQKKLRNNMNRSVYIDREELQIDEFSKIIENIGFIKTNNNLLEYT